MKILQIARPLDKNFEPDGWKRLGSGGDKTGFLAPGGKSVVLVMRDLSKLKVPLAWYDFARTQTSPHVIRVLEGPVHGTAGKDPVVMVRVELLQPLKDPLILGLHRGLYDVFYGKSARLAGRTLKAEVNGKFKALTRPVLTEYPDYINVLVKCLEAAPAGAKFDAHSRNVMSRKGVPVIIDPWIG